MTLGRAGSRYKNDINDVTPDMTLSGEIKTGSLEHSVEQESDTTVFYYS